jgi:hypothetical protein
MKLLFLQTIDTQRVVKGRQNSLISAQKHCCSIFFKSQRSSCHASSTVAGITSVIAMQMQTFASPVLSKIALACCTVQGNVVT